MIETSSKVIVANEIEVNRDPISGTPGAHPLGTGAGAASGGVAGAVVGMAVGGPVGSLIGAAVGAVAGGITGSSAAEMINPTEDEIFWRETYVREPFYTSDKNYDYYAPAFRAGWEGRVRHDGRSFAEAEADLEAAYNQSKGELDPSWSHVSPAAHAAWNRVDHNWHARPVMA